MRSIINPVRTQSTEFLIRLQVRNSSRGIEDEVLKVFDRLLEEEVDKITFNLIRVSTNCYRRIPDGSLTSKSEESSRTQGRDYFVKISNSTDESRKFLVRGEESETKLAVKLSSLHDPKNPKKASPNGSYGFNFRIKELIRRIDDPEINSLAQPINNQSNLLP
ncbi:hypothetical protein BY996DRAFT_6622420 [Phakopsora pachyrhizi]|nr:hypothetical protein BY996DRAFT_6622420 [Phakopsora pachyrhizi]